MIPYSYDRRKTAAQIDLHQKWREIVTKHAQAERHELDTLLHEAVPYFRSVGYDLDVKKSFLGKEYHGSDGLRIVGELHITERPENTVKAERPDQVKVWVDQATGLYGSPRRVGPHSWAVDISDS